MKIFTGAVLIGVVSPAALAATPERVQFHGSVQLEGAVPLAFDLQVPSRQTAILQLADGSRLELATPGSPDSQEGARIRLVSPSGKVMHTSTTPDAGLASTSFAYRVCDGQVTYMNPVPEPLPSCSDK